MDGALAEGRRRGDMVTVMIMPLRLLLRHAGNIAGGDRAREQRDEAFEQEGGEEEREEKREEKRERQCAVDVRRGKYQGIFVRDVNPPPSTVGNRSCGEGKKRLKDTKNQVRSTAECRRGPMWIPQVGTQVDQVCHVWGTTPEYWGTDLHSEG
jgi:hypothetical protein